MVGLFCRHGEYSMGEMLSRLNRNILINDILCNKKIKNKDEAIKEFIDGYKYDNSLMERLKANFNLYGRKGDKTNIKIYKVNTFRKDIILKYGWDEIEKLINNNLTNIPVLGAFFDGDWYMECAVIENNIVDFRFKFEFKKNVVTDDGVIKLEVYSNSIEARFYIDRNLICIEDSTEKERKAILSSIVSMPYYIISKTKEFTYSKPDYSEIFLTTVQLDSIKEALGGKLKVAVIEVFGDKGVRMRIEGADEEFENQSSTYKVNKDIGNKEELQIYWQDEEGNRNKVTIKKDCRIITTNYLTIKALDTIIKVIMSTIKSENILKPMDEPVRSYCKKNYRPAMRTKMIPMVQDKLNKSILEVVSYLLNKNSIDCQIDSKSLVIAFNIIKSSINSDKYLEVEYDVDDPFIFELLEYNKNDKYNKDKRNNAINILEDRLISVDGDLKKLVGRL